MKVIVFATSALRSTVFFSMVFATFFSMFLAMVFAVFVASIFAAAFTLTAGQSIANTITPNQHFKIEDPAEVSDDQAEQFYQRISNRMKNGYALADYTAAKNYQRWQRFNPAPYLSEGHGNRYLNNYGNKAASNYLSLEKGQQMATGAILAKDSFTIKKDGTVLPGALFLMEKLRPDVKAEYGDWRYVMVLPDGALLGDSEGTNAEAMQFCHGCHTAVQSTDYLFFLPPQK